VIAVSDTTSNLADATLPRFFYGTAWKEDRTQALVELALQAGFRGIDTANQRRHYHEAAVGQAIAAVIDRGLLSRSDLFVQTKFTFVRGQDHRLPYDPQAPIAMQVQQSFASSLQHLGVDHIDSYLLHGPMQRTGLADDDWAAWRAMEAISDTGRARFLGVSNFTVDQLEQLVAQARIRPCFVQNRCYAARGWDREVRTYCQSHGIHYQGFSLLTANPAIMTSPVVLAIAKRLGRTPQQVVFRFTIEIGILPLTGTSNERHMLDDLDVFRFHIDHDAIAQLERLARP
jgi:diketogulonate reductase-like aldo/keto reductase